MEHANPDGEPGRLTAEVARLERELERLESERQYLRLHAQNVEQELRRLVSEREARFRRLEAELARVNDAYRLVVTSRSWRLLAPLRAVARWSEARRRSPLPPD